MVCASCGQTLPENAKYCPHCGNEVSSAADNSVRIKKKKHGSFFSDPRKAYGFIVLNAAMALLIAYLILSSNTKNRIETANTSGNTSEIPAKTKVLIEELKNDPAAPHLKIEIGNQLFDAGNYAEAARYYRQALDIDSGNVAARIDLAVCYFNMEDYTRAIENMRMALRLEPNHPKGLFNIGVMYMTVGSPDSTQKYWRQLISDFPSSEEAKRASELLQGM